MSQATCVDPVARRASRWPLRVLMGLLGVASSPLASALTPLQFATPQTFSAAQSPYAIAVADLNGDGKPDIAVVSEVSGGVRVLLNTTPANATMVSFAQVQSFATGAGTSGIVAADINGDGKPDLVVVNTTDNTVSVLINTTLTNSTVPRFALAQNFAVGAFPLDLVVADFDGDGKPDIVTVNRSSGDVSLLQNTTATGAATATFAARRDIVVGTQPDTIAAADINGDGKPDLAIGASAAATVTVLLNQTLAGQATDFGAANVFQLSQAPDRLYLADLNRDGKPDVVAGNATTGAIAVMLNTTAPSAAKPTFGSPNLVSAGATPVGLAFADIDGDGIVDVIATQFGTKAITVLRNKTAAGAGALTASPEGNFATGNNPLALVAADINGDGLIDIVSANSGATTISVLLNTTPRVNLDQHGLTGSWYNPATGGQGFEIEVYPDVAGAGKGSLFAGWFTFPTTSSVTARRWYGLTGDVNSTTPITTLQVFDIEGGNLNAPPSIGPTGALGIATLQFSDCNTGAVTYKFTDTDGSARAGTIPLVRLTPNVTCTATGDSGAAATSYLLSGNWYNPDASGQGLMFDFSPSINGLFAAWYTFAFKGQQIGGPASQSWFTLQSGSFAPGTTALNDIPIVETINGVFDKSDPTSSFEAGTANITLQSCNAMTLSYTFKAGENKGVTGSVNLQRVGPVPPGCSLSQ